jgi:hypothetical protein
MQERKRVARDGWGAQLLALQDPAGTWAGGQSSDGGINYGTWGTWSQRSETCITGMVLSILRALDHFRDVNAPRDHRLAEAVDIIRSSRREDGRWALQHVHNGKTHFELARRGAPSRWNTLRALRVLKWWNAGGMAQGA